MKPPPEVGRSDEAAAVAGVGGGSKMQVGSKNAMDWGAQNFQQKGDFLNHMPESLKGQHAKNFKK